MEQETGVRNAFHYNLQSAKADLLPAGHWCFAFIYKLLSVAGNLSEQHTIWEFWRESALNLWGSLLNDNLPSYLDHRIVSGQPGAHIEAFFLFWFFTFWSTELVFYYSHFC